MTIGELARSLGTTTHAIRFYERHGLLPPARRSPNGYRVYEDSDALRLRILLGLRRLDVPLAQAARLAELCASGRCDEVSGGLRALIEEKRRELAGAMRDLRFLDQRIEHLVLRLNAGDGPRSLLEVGKGGEP